MKKIISIMLIPIILFAMSTSVLAKDNIDNNFKTKEGDIFAEYDVATGETTYFSVSELPNGTTCTWDYFSETKIQQMQNSLISFNKISDLNTSDIIGTDDRYYTPPTTAPYCAVV